MGDDHHVFFVGQLVLVYIFIEARHPVIGCTCPDFQRRIDYIFKPDGLTVNPGVTIVKLKLVNTFFDCVDTIFQFSSFLLLRKEWGFAFLWTAYFSQIVQFKVHIQILNYDTIVENRVLF